MNKEKNSEKNLSHIDAKSIEAFEKDLKSSKELKDIIIEKWEENLGFEKIQCLTEK